MGDSDSDSDEWGAAELPDIPLPKKPSSNKDSIQGEDDDEDGWATKLPVVPPPTTSPTTKSTTGAPMILVDMTALTQNDLSWPEIHSRFDRNSVNDMDAVKRLRKTIEADYGAYANRVEYVGDGIVIPCGSSVWKEALSRLRDENPGHYFCPIFPPKQS